MNGRKACSLIGILMTALLGTQSAHAKPSGFAAYIRRVQKRVIAGIGCEPYGGTRVLDCGSAEPGTTFTEIPEGVWRVTAFALTTAINPICEFRCECYGGTAFATPIFIDSSDGLPVELMSFSVDDEETGE